MKTLIVYYSYTGITDKVANVYADILRKKGDLTVQRLRPKQEITAFLSQCRAALGRKRAELHDNTNFDVKNYDLILLGSPVWAFGPVPVVNTYLDKLTGLNGKRVIVLLTSGSGAGVGNCFKNMKAVLEAKGAARIDEINIPNRKMSDGNFITSSLEKVL